MIVSTHGRYKPSIAASGPLQLSLKMIVQHARHVKRIGKKMRIPLNRLLMIMPLHTSKHSGAALQMPGMGSFFLAFCAGLCRFYGNDPYLEI